jgi:hypothetical protein
MGGVLCAAPHVLYLTAATGPTPTLATANVASVQIRISLPVIASRCYIEADSSCQTMMVVLDQIPGPREQRLRLYLYSKRSSDRCVERAAVQRSIITSRSDSGVDQPSMVSA